MKGRSGKIILGIVLLLLVSLGSTLWFQSWLSGKLEAYRNESPAETSAVPQETEEQLIVVASEPYIVEEPDTTALERYTQELKQLKQETEQLLERHEGLSEKEMQQRLTDSWDREMKSLAGCIADNMSKSERAAFYEEQGGFLHHRSRESMKELSRDKSGVTENIDYLIRVRNLTEERCGELIKDYAAYLDK